MCQIANSVFFECHNLKNLYSNATAAPTINDTSFDSSVSDCILHVPEGCIEDYQQKGWTMFAQIVDDIIPTGVNTFTATDGNAMIFSINGMRISSPHHNRIYIVKGKDGSYKKCIAK